MKTKIDSIMEKVQEFASAWALFGTRFGEHLTIEDTNVMKQDIRTSIEALQVQQESANSSNEPLITTEISLRFKLDFEKEKSRQLHEEVLELKAQIERLQNAKQPDHKDQIIQNLRAHMRPCDLAFADLAMTDISQASKGID